MKIYWVTCLLTLILILNVNAQPKNVFFDVTALGGYNTSDYIPFWLRSNQFGSVPLDKASISLIGATRKDYDPARAGIFDWGASLEGRLNAGYKINFTLIEGYAKVKVSIFELQAGRVKEITGLCDTSLSSGSWSVSGNALGIPKVQLSIPEFYTLPWFGQIFAFKGQFMHGWRGETPMRLLDTLGNFNTYLHQKSLYLKFGKPEWKWKLYGGFNHQAFWGDEHSFYNSDDFTLSPLMTYLYVVIGKPYSKGSIQRTRMGDHKGSIDLAIEYEFNKVKLLLYRQNLYEAGALYYFANIQDGLNGISIVNKNNRKGVFKWNRLLFEFLYTKNQAGEPWSPETPSSYEPYYNHGNYILGWSYRDAGLGNPFITPKILAREGLPSRVDEFFINNRVRVFHIGFEGSVQQWNYILKTSWSDNYGTYATTNEDQSTDIVNPGSDGVFGNQQQFSAFIAFDKLLKKEIRIGCISAFDIGKLFNNSFGILLKVSKSF